MPPDDPIDDEIIESARRVWAEGAEPDHVWFGNGDGTMTHAFRKADGSVVHEISIPEDDDAR